MKILYADADYSDDTPQPGWYIWDAAEAVYHGPFLSREAAYDEAHILGLEADYEHRMETRHNRSLMYPGAP